MLTLNSGSSSLKVGVYRVGPLRTETLLAESMAISGEHDALATARHFLANSNLPPPDAIGHRIVHGGPALEQHSLIDELVLRQLAAASAFAPLHMPAALAVIRVATATFPGIPQVACLDTVFHARLPDVARVLPIATDMRVDGLRRYGFHGLSCESIVRQIGNDLPDRMVIAHLGSGASVTAVRGGGSIDTSMGLTPTGGVLMGTRSGDLDPGVLVYLLREKKFNAAMLEDLVNRRSGLLGISGVSSDMRQLRADAPSNAKARLAIEMFCYSVRKHIAGMIAALDGIDLLVFTGGIGEHDAETRAAVCAGFSWLGIRLDAGRNQERTNPVSDSTSRCQVRVIASREDAEIARHTWAVVSG